MCGKGSSSNVLRGKRTSRADAAHCRIRKKTKQKQPTDGAAPCGLLSGPRSVGFCTPPLPALPSSRKNAVPRLPTKSPPVAAVESLETLGAAEPTRKARADRGDVAAHRRESGAITAS